jgi:hypothetical protein
MTATQISRDPFARTTLMREVVHTKSTTCSWCGNTRRNGTLFRYGTEKDAIYSRINWHRGNFCNKECHDAYHG